MILGSAAVAWACIAGWGVLLFLFLLAIDEGWGPFR